MLYSKLFSFPLLFTLGLLPGISGSPINATSPATASTETDTLAAITPLLSRFSILLDTKNFTALAEVFADDAVLGGEGAPQAITGLPAIQTFYRKQFGNSTVKTQHTSDTVYGHDFAENSAASTSYANALYFGPAVLERGGQHFPNQSVIFRERFDNLYAKDADGLWKIKLQTGPQVLVSCPDKDGESHY